MTRVTYRQRPRKITDARRVSVVIPCYNYAAYLEECVRSALDQRDVDVDVTIVDDASTDDSFEVAVSLADADPRVRTFRHDVNQGHLRTANEALGHATAEYVVKLDADDLLTPGSLARSSALLAAYEHVGLVYGWPEEFSGTPPLVEDSEPRSWTIWSGDKWLSRVLRRGHNVIMQPEAMMRRDALLDVGGGYSELLPWAEDYNLWLRLATRWSIGRVNGCVQGLYRVHAKSFQRSADDLQLSDLRGRVDATRLYIETTDGITASRSRLALASLARDARRLLAAQRDEPNTAAVTVAEYEKIARQLEDAAKVSATRSPVAWRGPLGRYSRRIEGAARWRRWRATGI